MFRQIGEKVIVGLISAVALGAIYAAWDAIKRSSVDIFIPSMAVIAFDAPECPTGWKVHREAVGRMVVGAGEHTNNDEKGRALTNHKVGATGGEESHTLSIEEMPSHAHGVDDKGHSHPITAHVSSNTQNGSVGWIGGRGPTNKKSAEPAKTMIDIQSAGNGDHHNNMPPYLALLYCIKE